MANPLNQCGARPKGPVLRASTYTTSGIVYPGDCCVLVSDGTVAVAAAGAVTLVGVALSYAASGGEVLIADDPAQRFIMSSDDGTIDAATDFNLNYAITATAGSTAYRISRQRIDGNTGVTDSNYQQKVLKLYPAIKNDLGAFASECEFIINNHAYKGQTGQLGV